MIGTTGQTDEYHVNPKVSVQMLSNFIYIYKVLKNSLFQPFFSAEAEEVGAAVTEANHQCRMIYRQSNGAITN